MKYLYIIPLLTILCCCNNNKAAKSAIPQAISKKNYSPAQQQKVIGGINFGISKKQFEKLYQVVLQSKNCESGCTIGQFKYDKAYPKFKNDQLYELRFTNAGSKYDGNDQPIPEILQNAYQAMKSEYGEPDSSHPLSSWTKGQNFTAYHWETGDKAIEITVNRMDMQFGVTVAIYKPSIKVLVEKEAAKP